MRKDKTTERTYILSELVCPVCGKIYIPAPFHVYKIKANKLVCSYKCQIEYENHRKLSEPNVVLNEKFISNLKRKAASENLELRTYIRKTTNDDKFANWFADFVERYSNFTTSVRYQTYLKLLKYFKEEDILGKVSDNKCNSGNE